MGITVSVTAPASGFVIPITLFLWGSVIVYCLHILEESVLGDVFVEKMKRHYWSGYDWDKFAAFNTILMTLNIVAVVLYDVLGGAFLIFPLALFAERFMNGLYHLFETIKMRTFSSGLLTGIIMWVLGYFVIRYAICRGEIKLVYLIISVAAGLVLEFLMTGFMFIPALRKRLTGTW